MVTFNLARPSRCLISFGIVLLLGGCDFLWPTEAPYDPNRCNPRCNSSEVCFEGKCVGATSDGTVPLPDGRADKGVATLDGPKKDTKDGPSRDQPTPDKLRLDKQGPDIVVPDTSVPDTSVADISKPDMMLPDKQVPDAPLPNCNDKTQNGCETDVDCGGGTCSACVVGKKCKTAGDCVSKVCQSGTCAVATCTDKVKNGPETDVDCGGGTCGKCDNTKACKQALDCKSGVCSGGVCVTASCTDKVKNGSETDVDCGGTCQKCVYAKGCKSGTDCASGSCVAGSCGSCGDGTINGADACDGTSLGNKTCKSAGFYTGTLACTKDCKLDTSGCTDCGNGVINSSEQCDGGQLGNQTCITQGFFKGTLLCKKACTFDAKLCSNCGNGKLDAGEACDGSQFGGKSCVGQGYVKGQLACTSACALDTSGCSNCGNGKIDTGEVCDGTNLATSTCTSLGMSSGTLACTTACAHDFAGCPWATAMGGTKDDWGTGIGLDAKGNVYVAGRFQDTATFGTTQLTSKGGNDIFLAKLTPSGTVEWAISQGGPNTDYVHDGAVDGAGNTYITGSFYSSTTIGTTSLTATGGQDFFVAKLDPSGKVAWVASGGGTSGDAGRGIAVDSSGNVYVVGSFYSKASVGTKILNAAGSNDIFLAVYSSAGALKQVTSAGGTGDDQPRDLAVDSTGNMYVAGYFGGTTSLGKTYTAGGLQDVFVAKFDTAGKVVWGTAAGGGGMDGAYAITVNNLGESFIAGNFEKTATFGSKKLTSGGGNDGFVAKVKSNGDIQYAIQIAGTGNEGASAIVSDSSGSFYAAGSFGNSATFGGKILTGGYNANIFVAKVSWTASVLWATSGGGDRSESPTALALDNSGNTYVTGYFQKTATFGGKSLSAKGTPGVPDVLVWKLDKNGK